MLGKPQLHELYYYLKLTRRVEEELARLGREGRVAGGLYLGIGQEPVGVGTAYALAAGDLLAPALRNIGALLVRGVRPFEIFTHLLGTRSGPTRGRSGALEIGDLARGLVAPIGPLAAQVAVMAGVALAVKLESRPQVALTYVGDGAIATGDFHEGLNFAAVHRLPLVVILENNHYAFSTPTSRIWGSEELYERARGYGVPGMPVDGGDVLQVLQVTGVAVERARAGKGPTLIEANCLRLGGHAAGHDLAGAPQLEGERDPIQRFTALLLENGILQIDERLAVDQRVEQLVEDALRLSQTDGAPPP